MLDPDQIAEIREYTRRQQMISHIYFMEQQDKDRIADINTKVPCIIRFCKKSTRSITRICTSCQNDLVKSRHGKIRP